MIAILMALAGVALAQPTQRPTPAAPLESQHPAQSSQEFLKSAPPPRGTPRDSTAPRKRPTVVTRNATDGFVWVTFYQDGAVETAGCAAPKESLDWFLSKPDAPYFVRAEMTRGTGGCEKPVSCNATIDRAPAMAALELRGGHQACNWAPVPPRPANLACDTKNCIHNVITNNPTAYHAWLTYYEWQVMAPRRIKGTHCVAPGGAVWKLQYGWEYLRVQLTSGPGCRGRTLCDTTMDVEFRGRTDRDVSIYPKNWAPGGGCWLQWGK